MKANSFDWRGTVNNLVHAVWPLAVFLIHLARPGDPAVTEHLVAVAIAVLGTFGISGLSASSKTPGDTTAILGGKKNGS